MLDTTREDRYLTASGLLTLAVVAYVDTFLENPGTESRLLGYLLFAGIFTLLSTSRVTLQYWVERSLLITEALVALAMLLSGNSSVMPILFVIWAAQLPKSFPRYTGWALLACVNALIVAEAVLLQQGAEPLVTALVFLGFQCFAASSSLARIRAREAKKALEVTNLQLKSAQSLLAQQGKNQERLRIARDLHDGIGHKLTALSLKLEHARHTVDVPVQPLISEFKMEVADTLQQLRETVLQIRSSQRLSLAEVVKAVQDILPSSVTLTWPEDLGVEDINLAEQLAFCIQEGISNALRHGQATRIDITQRRTGAPEIVVIDNGHGGSAQAASNGLTGMNERLAAFGGSATLSKNASGRGMQLRLQFAAQTDERYA
jgi:signal transduction histidine kinase